MSKKTKEEINEIDPYSVDRFSKVPSWLIVFILKFWAASAAIFFSIIGGLDVGIDFTTGTEMDGYAEMAVTIVIIIVITLFLTLFINYIVRPLVRLMYNRRNNTFKYNMINVKGFKSFLLCFPYMLGVTIVLYFVTSFLSYKGWVLDLFGTTGGLGIEPITFGLCFIALDSLCLLLKNLIKKAYERYRYNKLIKED